MSASWSMKGKDEKMFFGWFEYTKNRVACQANSLCEA